MVTLKDIAQACGVTISTVSNVLNGKPKVSEETRKRVLKVVEETGYKPNYFAQGMRKNKSKIIGIIAEDLDNFVSLNLIETMMAYCEENDYRTVMINLRMYDRYQDTWYNDEEKLQKVLKPAMQQMISLRVDGLVYIAGHCRFINAFPQDLEIPGVVVYGISNQPRFPSVVLEDEKGGYDMAKYLISMGHKQIGIITGNLDNRHATERLKGIQKAFFEEGVLFNPDWCYSGNWAREGGYAAAAKILPRGLKCIFCMNDLMAAGVYDYMLDHHIDYKEISVLGYDNREVAAYMWPRLSTYDLHLKDIARTAAQVILEQIENHDSEREEGMIKRIEGEMVLRDSVHPVNQ